MIQQQELICCTQNSHTQTAKQTAVMFYSVCLTQEAAMSTLNICLVVSLKGVKQHTCTVSQFLYV